ncbi:hypothetical protein TNCV_1253961 [Trichonephila clavipes]|nr:hypothetical protein TNCV_1253961 [Trichonephila clavipes]
MMTREIVTSVQAESDPVDDETDKDEDNNNKSSKDPSTAGAFPALETAMEWCISAPMVHTCLLRQGVRAMIPTTLNLRYIHYDEFINKAIGFSTGKKSLRRVPL